MSEKILCVDDDQNVLLAFQRHLRKQFQVSLATDGPAALRMIAAGGPFAVVVSDMRMPGMDGVEFLARVKDISPDTVRIMLTGNADTSTAIGAVNEGNIFRFLTKPCQPSVLSQAIGAGLAQYRLVTAERELLAKTLSGCIAVLTEILSLVDPESFGLACSLRDRARVFGRALESNDTWELELAAMLAGIGRITVPAETLARHRSGAQLSEVETDLIERIPETGYRLLARIPRLEPVAESVYYQSRHFDGSGFPRDERSGEDIPQGARVLKILSDLTLLESGGLSRLEALDRMETRAGWYDLRLLGKLRDSLDQECPGVQISSRLVCLDELRVGQVLRADVQTRQGALLIPAGHVISETILGRIRNFARVNGVKQPILVEETELPAGSLPAVAAGIGER